MQEYIIQNIRNLNTAKLMEYLQYRGEKQAKLFALAEQIRNTSSFGKKVELRSVIEISNICNQKCRYCGMGKNNDILYSLSKNEIIERIKILANVGRRTILIQSGENTTQRFIDDISTCCSEALNLYPDIKIILCLGNLKKEQYQQLRNSGAQRYILKFETGNPKLHKYCRPNDTIKNRLECIQNLIDTGFQVGTGNIIGLPNQTLDDIVDDLILTTKFKLSMVSATKFIPNANSEFKNNKIGDINLTLNFNAILRILHPECLIPSTSSLELENKNGQMTGLMIGCNTITVHDGTPANLKANYHIYSDNRFTPAEQHCRNIIAKAGLVAEKYLI